MENNHQKSTQHYSEATGTKWLKSLETIVLREIKNKDYTLKQLAGELYVSYSTLHRRIVQLTGNTPNRYIRSIKLTKAKNLCEDGKFKTINDLAQSVGYQGITHFKKEFEKEFGISVDSIMNKVKS